MQASKEDDPSAVELPGRVAVVGLGLPGPECLASSVLELINQVNFLVVTRGVATVLAYSDLKLQNKAGGQTTDFFVIDDESDYQEAVNKTIERCSDNTQIGWILDGSDRSLAERCEKDLADSGCQVAPMPHPASGLIAMWLSGIKPTTTVTLADATNKPEITGRDDVVISGTADEFDEVLDHLLQADLKAKVLLVTGCGSSEHKTVKTTVNKLAKVKPSENFVLITGPDIAQADLWWENRPLHGWRILVPLTTERLSGLQQRVISYGASCETVETLAIEEPKNSATVDRCVRRLVDGSYQWIVFTTEHAVEAIISRLRHLGLDARSFAGVRVAVSDSQAEKALKAWGIEPDLVSFEPTSSGLAAEFPAYDEMFDPLDRVLIPSAEVATETLSQALTDLGWTVDEIAVYRAVRATPPSAEMRESIKTGDFDAVVFTSATSVRNLIGIAGKPHSRSVIAAIGPATAKACEEHGLRVDVQASAPVATTLVDELASFAVERRKAILESGKAFLKPSQTRRRRKRK